MGSAFARMFDWAPFGTRDALVDSERRISYAQLGAQVNGAARALLHHGVQGGARVAVLGPTAASSAIGTLAVGAVGAIAVPLSGRATPAELQHVLADSGTSLVLVHPSLVERLPPVPPACTVMSLLEIADAEPADRLDQPAAPGDEDTALLVYTSGTTARSKGVALPWRAVVGNMLALGGSWGLGPHDTSCLALPLFHVHGLCIGIFAALLHGVTVRLHPRFDPGIVVADFRDHGATLLCGVPTMYVGLLEHLAQHPEDARALAGARLFTAGSAALAVDTFAAFEAATGHRVLERYGMTETLITLTNPLHGERRPGTVGRAVPGVEVRIVDDRGQLAVAGALGEIYVRGDSLMTGYWGDDGATAAAFDGAWFRTGDLARADDDGYVRIVGRTSTDIVKSGGFKLSTREIEDALRAHARVVDVAVVGAADPKWGERVVAVLVVRGDASIDAVAAELSAHCREHLADYKCPRQWLLVDELPRNAMGKLEKTRLRRAIERDYSGDADLRRVHSQ